ncbi:MAG TPA: hypothetical protein PKB13_01025, partial [Clostridia bacterium]|nr:hypothetical protein [Clostridia bacterium]
QNPLLATTCGFKSHLRHQKKSQINSGFFIYSFCESTRDSTQIDLHPLFSIAKTRLFDNGNKKSPAIPKDSEA